MPWAEDGGDEPNAARCSSISKAPGAAGEACRVDGERFSGVDDCGEGLFCYEVDDTTGEGLCRELCPGGNVCDNPETSCISWFDGALPVCSRTCSNLSSVSCPSGNGCYALPVTGNCDFSACGPQVGAGAQGDACIGLNDCENGFQCVDGSRVPDCESDRCCTQYCDLSVLDGCAALPGTTCDTEMSSANCPPTFYYVGVCITP